MRRTLIISLSLLALVGACGVISPEPTPIPTATPEPIVEVDCTKFDPSASESIIEKFFNANCDEYWEYFDKQEELFLEYEKEMDEILEKFYSSLEKSENTQEDHQVFESQILSIPIPPDGYCGKYKKCEDGEYYYRGIYDEDRSYPEDWRYDDFMDDYEYERYDPR